MAKLTRRQKNKIDCLLPADPGLIAQRLKLDPGDVSEYLSFKAAFEREKRDRPTALLSLKFNNQLGPIKTFLDFLRINRGRIVVLVLAGFFVYSSGLTNSFVSDDLPLLQSPYLTNPLQQVRDEPVSAVINSATYSLNYLFDGSHPLGYHLVNVLLHLSLTVLLFFFLSLVLEGRIPFLASLIFAVHPLHSEAVFWVSGRHYILYAIFLVTALIFYLFSQEGRPRFYYWGSLLFFVLSVYSFPEQAIVFPFFLALIDFCLGRLQKNWSQYLPFLALTALFIFLSYARIAARVQSVDPSLQPFQRGSPHFLIADVVAVATYLKLFVLPWGLSFYHENLSVSLPILLLMGLIVFTLSVLAVLALKKNRLFFLAAGIFLISLLPTLTPLKVSWIVAERYTYFALLGLALLLAALFDFFYQKIKFRKLSLYLSLLLMIVFSGLTLVRGFDWKDEDTLWLATAQASPTSSKAWNNMGDYYGRHGDPQKSFEAFVEATKLNPSYADAWHNAGNVLLQTSRIDESIPYFEKSLVFNPTLIEADNNLALAYHRKGDQKKALDFIQKSLAINPHSAKTYTALAVISYENGDKQKALEALKIALQLDPSNPALHQTLLQVENELPH